MLGFIIRDPSFFLFKSRRRDKNPKFKSLTL